MITMIIDGQWGSTGKGKLAYYLQKRRKYQAVFGENGPNAGHTVKDRAILPCGKTEVMFRQLPSASIDPDVMVLIGPGAIVDPELFLKEVEIVGHPERIFVHPKAAVIQPSDATQEQLELMTISSTMKGTAIAQVRKLMRQPNATADKHADVNQFTHGWMEAWEHAVNCHHFLVEVSQGFDLSLSSHFYPYVTSREITPNASLSRCGIHHIIQEPVEIFASLRMHPIRVGSLEGYTSGACWPDQKEISWEELGVKPELTTVTKRVRRVFTWSRMQFNNMLNIVRPTRFFINFAQYAYPNVGDRNSQDASNFADWVEREIAARTVLKTADIVYGWGADDAETGEMKVSAIHDQYD